MKPLLLSLVFAFSGAAVAAERPNLVWIMFDDLGYADPGCYGGKVIPTPNFDRLAAEGTRFTSAYAGNPQCAPSREVLMTGRHTGRTKLRSNFADKNGIPGMLGGSRGFIDQEDTTIAEILREAGYATCLSGKWGIAEADTPGIPTLKGFDRFLGILNQRHADTHFPEWIWSGTEKVTLPGNKDGALGDYAADRFADHAIDFINDSKDRPFFLYLAFCIPHSEFVLPDFGAFADKPWTDKQKAYARMVADGDRHVGRVLDALEEAGIAGNTLLFVCSDNGGAGSNGPPFHSIGPFSGGKFSLREGGIRTPMLVRWPGRVPAGAVNDAPWHFGDFLPTAAALAGAEAPAGITGTDVLPTLLGKSQPDLAERLLYWETTKNGFRRAGRLGKWKALEDPAGSELQLFDLSTDLQESRNLATEHPEVLADLERRMNEARRPSRFHFGPDGT